MRADTAAEAPIRISELLTDPAGVPRARERSAEQQN